MRPVFADPKTDFVFKKLFGTEEHKDLLIALLDALLGRRGEQSIREVTFLTEEQRPKVEELKFSVVDVRCRDARGNTFVVEMQVLQVEGFEKRVVYNASKAYVNQLGRGEDYPTLNDIFAITICDFVLWPAEREQPPVPLVSHWRVKEQGGRAGLSQVQYVFVELPKLSMERQPKEEVEEWAYVFREAPRLTTIPEFIHSEGPKAALDVARTAHFSAEEWEAYDRVKVAVQDARGALAFAERVGEVRGLAAGEAKGLAAGEAKGLAAGEAKGLAAGRTEGLAAGRTEGLAAGKRETLLTILELRGLEVTELHRARIAACSEVAVLEAWIARGRTSPSTDHALSPSES